MGEKCSRCKTKKCKQEILLLPPFPSGELKVYADRDGYAVFKHKETGKLYRSYRVKCQDLEHIAELNNGRIPLNFRYKPSKEEEEKVVGEELDKVEVSV